MKLICLEYEMKSLFFSLMKRTKNQGFGIVVKAQISIFFWRFSLRALYFVHSWNADFVGDLLRSYLQKSSNSVRDQNPTIPRPEGWFWIGNFDLRMKLFCLDFELIYFERKSLFFCLIKRTKNQGFGIVVKARISNFFWRFSLRGALSCSLLKMLILLVICCAASSKSLAFQFAIKTQQSKGQKKILNEDL